MGFDTSEALEGVGKYGCIALGVYIRMMDRQPGVRRRHH